MPRVGDDVNQRGAAPLGHGTQRPLDGASRLVVGSHGFAVPAIGSTEGGKIRVSQPGATCPPRELRLLMETDGPVAPVVHDQYQHSGTVLNGGGDPDQIRRDSAYLDTVETIWQSLKRYLD